MEVEVGISGNGSVPNLTRLGWAPYPARRGAAWIDSGPAWLGSVWIGSGPAWRGSVWIGSGPAWLGSV